MAPLPPPDVIDAITRKKARYGYYADTKQWHRYAGDVYPPGWEKMPLRYLDTAGQPIVVRPGGLALAFDTIESWIGFFQPFFAPLQTLHNFGPGHFEQVANDEVRARFGMEDQLMFPQLPWGLAEIRGGGFYEETYRRIDGDWYMVELELHRTYQKMTFPLWAILKAKEWLGIPLI